MTIERIKDFKKIILPFFTKYFLKENYENLGKSDAEEFEKDFNEILNLAAKALEQEPCEDAISREDALMCMTGEYIADMSYKPEDIISKHIKRIRALPPVTPTHKWIPVKFRPLTDEEQEEYPDYCYMADCQMPDDGEEILVSTKSGRVEKDECRFDDGYYLDSGSDWQTDIVAWMPLPKPYKPQESEDKK